MTDLRHDALTGRWVAVAPGRAERPGAAGAAGDSPESCPFCAGNERQAPPETLRLGDAPFRWSVRVVPNLYPALERQEVVIHGPVHARSVAELPDTTLELVAEAWQRRARDAGGTCFPLLNEGTRRGRVAPTFPFAAGVAAGAARRRDRRRGLRGRSPSSSGTVSSPAAGCEPCPYEVPDRARAHGAGGLGATCSGLRSVSSPSSCVGCNACGASRSSR